MTTALIIPPASEPLSLIDVKAHLRIDHDHEDDMLTQTLKAARQYTEFSSGQKLITQIWRQYEICFPKDRVLALRVGPVQSIQAVTTYDKSGTPHQVAAQDVLLVRGSAPQSIELSAAIDPALAENGFEIDLVVGIGDTGVEVPDTLKRAILLLVAHWYEFRGAVAPQDQPVSLPPGFETLMQPFVRKHL